MRTNESSVSFSIIPGNHNQIKQSSNAVNSHLEALRVLSNSLMREVESIQVKEISFESANINLLKEVQRFEIDLIRSALVRTGGRQRAAARLLGVKMTTLNAKIKRYGIEANSRF